MKTSVAAVALVATPAYSTAPVPDLPQTMVVSDCFPGPWIVFFEWNQAIISPEAGSILANVVSNCTGRHDFDIIGHTDRSGDEQYNVDLARRRAEAVGSFLTRTGGGDGVITIDARGESSPRVATGDDVRALENRRVEIMMGLPAPR